VGGAAQTNLIKGLSGGIRTDLAQYRELAAFAQFASDLDEATRKQLDRGARVTELLKQAQYSPQSIGLMASTLFAVNKGYLDDIEVKKVLSFENGMHAFLKDKHAAMLATMEKNGAKWDVKPAKPDDSDAKKAFKKECQDAEAELAAAIADFKKTGTY
jgi:F-type H+-transporting ATPase subunit alpha